MNKDRIKTISNREIKYSLKRFLSLLIMSMLGVGVFVGIKMASHDMIKSLDTYYDNTNSYDIKILSTLGLTNDDIKSLRNIDGVKEVYGSYSKDVMVENKDKELVIKVIGITKNINKIDIIKGRLPKNNKETIIEEYFFEEEGLNLGDNITIKDEDTFNETTLEIVGIVKSPLFITAMSPRSNRGNTNLGTGKVNYYMYVNNSNFNLDYYTESYITLDNSKEELTNSKEYKDIVNITLTNINKIKKERETTRYNEIYNKINNEIKKEEDKYLTEFNNAKLQLDTANGELINAKEKLDNSKIELDNASIELEKTKNELDIAKEELDNNEKELNFAKEELDNNELKLKLAKEEIDNAKESINNELLKYNLTLEDINDFRNLKNNLSYETIKELVDKNSLYYEEIIISIDKLEELKLLDNIFNLINNDNLKEELINKIPTDIENYEEIINIINKIYNINIEDIINNLNPNIPNYDKIINILNNYNKLKQLIDILEKLEQAEKEYNEGLIQLNNYKKEYEDGVILLNNYKEEYNNGYNTYLDYYNQYEKGIEEYSNGLKLYESNYNLYNSKLEEYYNSKKLFDLKMIEAKKELDKIPKPNWYIYERLDNTEYSGFIDDSNSIANLAKIFPVIFYAVAILISLVSMSRMVEEDRLEIGTLKSLGFNNRHIRKKYLIYSGSATLIGGIIGSILGFTLLPLYVWNIYKLLYDIPVFKYDLNPTNTIIGILLAIISICGTTLITIRKVVKEKPSELLRPKSPSNGKRILLERIKFIWNRINFSNKIMFRNLFRYKKRALITIGGILGCTSVMLVGFGIRDSVIDIPNIQYNDIFHFDEMVYLNSNISNDELNNIFSNDNIKVRVNTYMTNVNVDNYQVNLLVIENENNINNILSLKNKNTNKLLKLKDNEIIISDKLSDLTNKKIKDNIIFKTNDNINYQFKISSIFENYVGHYIIMNKNTYEKYIDKFNTNISYLKLNNLKEEEKLAKELLKKENVITILSVNSTIESVNDSLGSLNSVVIILILLSAALSFVVLYNLANINISERKREIATLKVLGFNDKEVDNYIMREMNILTIIGIILGLIIGTFLTYIIVDTVEIEMVRFLHKVNITSYIITSILILVFSLIINKIIHYALKKIDMIESLKSVE